MRATALTNAGLRPLSTYIHGVRHQPSLTGQGYYANQFDACLGNDFALWQQITRVGLDKLCCPAGRDPYAARPWVAMPDGGREFQKVSVLQVSAYATAHPGGGVDMTVLTEPVPYGYDGVVNAVVCGIDPPAGSTTNFSEGSGQVTWRLQANKRHLRNLGATIVSRGSIIDPTPMPNGGLRVYERNSVQWLVNISAAGLAILNPNSYIRCAIFGWFYPR